MDDNNKLSDNYRGAFLFLFLTKTQSAQSVLLAPGVLSALVGFSFIFFQRFAE